MSKNLQIQTSFDTMKNKNHNFQSNLTDYLSISKIYTNPNNITNCYEICDNYFHIRWCRLTSLKSRFRRVVE